MRRAVSFLTPFGGPSAPSPDALEWFPVVGAAMGAVVGGCWWIADQVWPPAVAAAIAVAVDLGVTGLLHIDGLADAADGLLPPLESTERRLAVMATPDVGAFGLAVTVAVLLLRLTAFVVLEPHVALVAGLWCASRTTMAVAARVVPYVGAGLAEPFLASRSADRVAVTGVVLSGVLAAIGSGALGIGAVLGVLLAGVAVVELARARVGGFTGDVLGAAGTVGETVGLLVAAAGVR